MKKELEKDMTPRLIGETYLRKPTETSRQRCKYGVYRCQYCGQEFECATHSIKSGNTRSCGCLIKKHTGRQTGSHNLYYHRFYATWSKMLHRCNNPKNKKYMDYGGRGINVCEEWLDIKIFIEWAEATHPNTEGLSLDRIDNDKGYSPENCRWADKTIQAINRRIMKSNTSGYVGVTSNGANWTARITVNNKRVCLGTFFTKKEAAQARDTYIIENKLPNKLSTEY